MSSDSKIPYPCPTPEELAAEVKRYPDLEIGLLADEFIGGICVRCGSGAALFATPIWFTCCSRCMAERMRKCLSEGAGWPWWVEYLAEAGEAEAARQDKAAWGSLEVSFDDLYKCARCGVLVPQQDARYHIPPGTKSGAFSPHCIPCFDALKAGEEGPDSPGGRSS